MSNYMLFYPDWLRTMTRGKEDAFCADEPITVGVSGGRTSALMAFLTREHGRGEVYNGFRNTSREHSQTYLFLQRMEAAGIGPEWTEFRKPAQYGAPPSEAGFEVVTAATARRDGSVFEAFLETLAEYRAVVKGLGPVRPFANMRLCSSYMKIKISNQIAHSKGWDCFTTFVGLRADEPQRVAKMRIYETREKTFKAPLYECGITKEHVNRFWAEQEFNLDIPANLGNCSLCFLKDEAHLAHNMAHDVSPEEAQWWIDIQQKYGDFKSGTSYANLLAEVPVRESIRLALSQPRETFFGDDLGFGKVPPCPEGFNPYRYRLLIKQEKRVLREGIIPIQCNCEAAELLTDELILNASPAPLVTIHAIERKSA